MDDALIHIAVDYEFPSPSPLQKGDAGLALYEQREEGMSTCLTW